MHAPVLFQVAYTFAVLTPAVQVVDAIIQWLIVQHKSWDYIYGRFKYLLIALSPILALIVQHKSWVYIFGRFIYLLIALSPISALIVHIHNRMDGPEAVWMPALVAFCGFSTFVI